MNRTDSSLGFAPDPRTLGRSGSGKNKKQPLSREEWTGIWTTLERVGNSAFLLSAEERAKLSANSETARGEAKPSTAGRQPEKANRRAQPPATAPDGTSSVRAIMASRAASGRSSPSTPRRSASGGSASVEAQPSFNRLLTAMSPAKASQLGMNRTPTRASLAAKSFGPGQHEPLGTRSTSLRQPRKQMSFSFPSDARPENQDGLFVDEHGGETVLTPYAIVGRRSAATMKKSRAAAEAALFKKKGLGADVGQPQGQQTRGQRPGAPEERTGVRAWVSNWSKELQQKVKDVAHRKAMDEAEKAAKAAAAEAAKQGLPEASAAKAARKRVVKEMQSNWGALQEAIDEGEASLSQEDVLLARMTKSLTAIRDTADDTRRMASMKLEGFGDLAAMEDIAFDSTALWDYLHAAQGTTHGLPEASEMLHVLRRQARILATRGASDWQRVDAMAHEYTEVSIGLSMMGKLQKKLPPSGTTYDHNAEIKARRMSGAKSVTPSVGDRRRSVASMVNATFSRNASRRTTMEGVLNDELGLTSPPSTSPPSGFPHSPPRSTPSPIGQIPRHPGAAPGQLPHHPGAAPGQLPHGSRQPEAAGQPPGQAGAAGQLPDRAEAARQLPDRAEAARQLPGRAEAARQFPGRAEAARQLPGRAEPAGPLPGHYVAAGQPPGRPEPGAQLPPSFHPASTQPTEGREAAEQPHPRPPPVAVAGPRRRSGVVTWDSSAVSPESRERRLSAHGPPAGAVAAHVAASNAFSQQFAAVESDGSQRGPLGDGRRASVTSADDLAYRTGRRPGRSTSPDAERSQSGWSPTGGLGRTASVVSFASGMRETNTTEGGHVAAAAAANTVLWRELEGMMVEVHSHDLNLLDTMEGADAFDPESLRMEQPTVREGALKALDEAAARFNLERKMSHSWTMARDRQARAEREAEAATRAALHGDCLANKSMARTLSFLIGVATTLKQGSTPPDAGALLCGGLELLLAQLQWQLALLKLTTGAASPHLRALHALLLAFDQEAAARRAAQAQAVRVSVAHEDAAGRLKAALKRVAELERRLAEQGLEMKEVRTDLALSTKEVHVLEGKLEEANEIISELEGDMDAAEARHMAAASVLEGGKNFRDVARDWYHGAIEANSKEIQVASDGPANDPSAIPPPKKKKKKGKKGRAASPDLALNQYGPDAPATDTEHFPELEPDSDEEEEFDEDAAEAAAKNEAMAKAGLDPTDPLDADDPPDFDVLRSVFARSTRAPWGTTLAGTPSAGSQATSTAGFSSPELSSPRRGRSPDVRHRSPSPF